MLTADDITISILVLREKYDHSGQSLDSHGPIFQSSYFVRSTTIFGWGVWDVETISILVLREKYDPLAAL